MEIIKFQDLTIDLLYECLYLRSKVFIVEQTCPYLDCDGKDKDAFHLLLCQEKKLIGYLRILKAGVSFQEVSIGRVVVCPDHRDQGIGKKIMLEALTYIREVLNEKMVRISAQAYLEAFYTSLGFKRVSDNYYEDNILHLEMLISLEIN